MMIAFGYRYSHPDGASPPPRRGKDDIFSERRISERQDPHPKGAQVHQQHLC